MNWSCTWKTSDVQPKCQGPLQLLSPPFLVSTWDSRHQNASFLDFIGAKDGEGGGDNWGYKSISINNMKEERTEIDIGTDLLTLSSAGGPPTFSLTTESFWLPSGGLKSHLSKNVWN